MAKEYAKTVEVPEFDEKAAYDHDRPISGLIRNQLLHLHMVEQVLPEKDRTGENINHLLTERQASEYIQKVTARLHRYGKPGKKKASRKKKVTSGKRAGKKSGKPSKTKPPAKKRK
jgi:hypothetical protein